MIPDFIGVPVVPLDSGSLPSPPRPAAVTSPATPLLLATHTGMERLGIDWRVRASYILGLHCLLACLPMSTSSPHSLETSAMWRAVSCSALSGPPSSAASLICSCSEEEGKTPVAGR